MRKGLEQNTQFVECLGNMAVVSEESSRDLLSYTKLWMEKVNRGALFPFHDHTFYLFVEIVRCILPKHIVGRCMSMETIDKLVKKVTCNEEVQFLWTILSQDVDFEEDSQELLYDTFRQL